MRGTVQLLAGVAGAISRRGALMLGLVAACRRRRHRDGEGPLARRLLDLAESAGQDARDTHAAIIVLADQVRRTRAVGRSPVESLNHTIFEGGFVREIEERGPDFMLLPSVLVSRRGSCVGLGSLYLVLAERLGWKAHGVLVPGHFFVRVDDRAGEASPAMRSVELLRRGEAMPEEWYRQKYAVPTRGGAAYLRPLIDREVAAVIHFNLGNETREAGQLALARRHYQQAVADLADWPEAHASLGLTHHLEGQLTEARQAYERAADLSPALPGLGRNRALLEQEISAQQP